LSNQILQYYKSIVQTHTKHSQSTHHYLKVIKQEPRVWNNICKWFSVIQRSKKTLLQILAAQDAFPHYHRTKYKTPECILCSFRFIVQTLWFMIFAFYYLRSFCNLLPHLIVGGKCIWCIMWWYYYYYTRKLSVKY